MYSAGSYRIIAFTLLLFTSSTVIAQKHYDLNNNCRRAYEEIMKLKLTSGQELLDLEKKQNPNNLLPYFFENYIDFFVLFFDEDPAAYKARKDNADRRIDMIDEGPDSSGFKLYCKSVINMQWAIIKIKFNERWSAGWQFRRSFMQIKENRRTFPSFELNDMIYGGLQTVVGTIPDGYKWLSNLFGLRGNIRDGMHLLDKFTQNRSDHAKLFHDEAVFYYLYLKFYVENKPEEVFDYIKDQKLDCVNNHLFAFMLTNLAINHHRAETAKQAIQDRNPSPEYYPLQFWNYEMGCARLYHLEPDAIAYFERFVSSFKGRFYVKDAYHKLSWSYYLKGDMNKAEYYRKLVIDKGVTDTEADKNALREAKLGTYPNKLLLQARLLNDGGYSADALRLLDGKSTYDFASAEERLEFNYWLARIYDELNRQEDAIKAYKATIVLGESRTEYYAARSALQIGYIYEERSDKKTAIEWFRRCINMKDHDYENAIEQKAKAGIARCSGN